MVRIVIRPAYWFDLKYLFVRNMITDTDVITRSIAYFYVT